MTQPIQEPNTERALQGFAYARDQIFRRPAPETCPCPTELVSVRGAAEYPITVNNNTWTAIAAVNWDSTYEQGEGTHIHVNTVNNPDQIQIYHDAVFTFSGCIQWDAAFTATRRLRIGPSGSFFPEGSGLNEFDLGEEGTNNTFGTTMMANFAAGSDPQVMTIEVWQDSGVSQTVTGDTSFLLVLIGLIEE